MESENDEDGPLVDLSLADLIDRTNNVSFANICDASILNLTALDFSQLFNYKIDNAMTEHGQGVTTTAVTPTKPIGSDGGDGSLSPSTGSVAPNAGDSLTLDEEEEDVDVDVERIDDDFLIDSSLLNNNNNNFAVEKTRVVFTSSDGCDPLCDDEDDENDSFTQLSLTSEAEKENRPPPPPPFAGAVRSTQHAAVISVFAQAPPSADALHGSDLSANTIHIDDDVTSDSAIADLFPSPSADEMAQSSLGQKPSFDVSQMLAEAPGVEFDNNFLNFLNDSYFAGADDSQLKIYGDVLSTTSALGGLQPPTGLRSTQRPTANGTGSLNVLARAVYNAANDQPTTSAAVAFVLPRSIGKDGRRLRRGRPRNRAADRPAPQPRPPTEHQEKKKKRRRKKRRLTQPKRRSNPVVFDGVDNNDVVAKDAELQPNPIRGRPRKSTASRAGGSPIVSTDVAVTSTNLSRRSPREKFKMTPFQSTSKCKVNKFARLLKILGEKRGDNPKKQPVKVETMDGAAAVDGVEVVASGRRRTAERMPSAPSTPQLAIKRRRKTKLKDITPKCGESANELCASPINRAELVGHEPRDTPISRNCTSDGSKFVAEHVSVDSLAPPKVCVETRPAEQPPLSDVSQPKDASSAAFSVMSKIEPTNRPESVLTGKVDGPAESQQKEPLVGPYQSGPKKRVETRGRKKKVTCQAPLPNNLTSPSADLNVPIPTSFTTANINIVVGIEAEEEEEADGIGGAGNSPIYIPKPSSLSADLIPAAPTISIATNLAPDVGVDSLGGFDELPPSPPAMAIDPLRVFFSEDTIHNLSVAVGDRPTTSETNDDVYFPRLPTAGLLVYVDVVTALRVLNTSPTLDVGGVHMSTACQPSRSFNHCAMNKGRASISNELVVTEDFLKKFTPDSNAETNDMLRKLLSEVEAEKSAELSRSKLTPLLDTSADLHRPGPYFKLPRMPRVTVCVPAVTNWYDLIERDCAERAVRLPDNYRRPTCFGPSPNFRFEGAGAAARRQMARKRRARPSSASDSKWTSRRKLSKVPVYDETTAVEEYGASPSKVLEELQTNTSLHCVYCSRDFSQRWYPAHVLKSHNVFVAGETQRMMNMLGQLSAEKIAKTVFRCEVCQSEFTDVQEWLAHRVDRHADYFAIENPDQQSTSATATAAAPRHPLGYGIVAVVERVLASATPAAAMTDGVEEPEDVLLGSTPKRPRRILSSEPDSERGADGYDEPAAAQLHADAVLDEFVDAMVGGIADEPNDNTNDESIDVTDNASIGQDEVGDGEEGAGESFGPHPSLGDYMAPEIFDAFFDVSPSVQVPTHSAASTIRDMPPRDSISPELSNNMGQPTAAAVPSTDEIPANGSSYFDDNDDIFVIGTFPGSGTSSSSQQPTLKQEPDVVKAEPTRQSPMRRSRRTSDVSVLSLSDGEMDFGLAGPSEFQFGGGTAAALPFPDMHRYDSDDSLISAHSVENSTGPRLRRNAEDAIPLKQEPAGITAPAADTTPYVSAPAPSTSTDNSIENDERTRSVSSASVPESSGQVLSSSEPSVSLIQSTERPSSELSNPMSQMPLLSRESPMTTNTPDEPPPICRPDETSCRSTATTSDSAADSMGSQSADSIAVPSSDVAVAEAFCQRAERTPSAPSADNNPSTTSPSTEPSTTMTNAQDESTTTSMASQSTTTTTPANIDPFAIHAALNDEFALLEYKEIVKENQREVMDKFNRQNVSVIDLVDAPDDEDEPESADELSLNVPIEPHSVTTTVLDPSAASGSSDDWFDGCRDETVNVPTGAQSTNRPGPTDVPAAELPVFRLVHDRKKKKKTSGGLATITCQSETEITRPRGEPVMETRQPELPSPDALRDHTTTSADGQELVGEALQQNNCGSRFRPSAELPRPRERLTTAPQASRQPDPSPSAAWDNVQRNLISSLGVPRGGDVSQPPGADAARSRMRKLLERAALTTDAPSTPPPPRKRAKRMTKQQREQQQKEQQPQQQQGQQGDAGKERQQAIQQLQQRFDVAFRQQNDQPLHQLQYLVDQQEQPPIRQQTFQQQTFIYQQQTSCTYEQQSNQLGQQQQQQNPLQQQLNEQQMILYQQQQQQPNFGTTWRPDDQNGSAANGSGGDGTAWRDSAFGASISALCAAQQRAAPLSPMSAAVEAHRKSQLQEMVRAAIQRGGADRQQLSVEQQPQQQQQHIFAAQFPQQIEIWQPEQQQQQQQFQFQQNQQQQMTFQQLIPQQQQPQPQQQQQPYSSYGPWGGYSNCRQ